jgi:hypothetical protein
LQKIELEIILLQSFDSILQMAYELSPLDVLFGLPDLTSCLESCRIRATSSTICKDHNILRLMSTIAAIRVGSIVVVFIKINFIILIEEIIH